MISWYIATIFSAFLLTIGYIAQKKGLHGERTIVFAALLYGVTVVTLLPFIGLIDFSMSGIELFFIILNAVFWAIGVYLLFTATKHMHISHVSPLTTFQPLFVIALAYVFLREVLTGRQFFGAGLIILGAYYLEMTRHNFKSPIEKFWHAKYIHYIMVSMLMYACSSVINRHVVKTVDPLALLFVTRVSLAVIFMAIALMQLRPHELVKGWKKEWLAIITVGIAFNAHYFFELIALKQADVGLVVAFRQISALFTIIIAGKLMNEAHILHKIISCLIMIAGAAIVLM